jgi:4-amino-4-deoxy-L-arabinose transferase-like glycosyltransferase
MTTSRILLLLTAASLAVRLLLLVAVGPELVPLHDEGEYLKRGKAFAAIVERLTDFESPPERTIDRAYGNGTWPPTHPLLIGLALRLFGESTTIARLAIVVISSLTTPLVFLLTLSLARRPAALWAAVLHLIHPSFLAFSHYLWSETTFIFFLLLTALSLFRSGDTPSIRRQMLWAVLAGLSLGLVALTRAVALPLVVVIPIWMVAAGRGSRAAWGRAGLLLGIVVLVVSPWQWMLQRREGQFVPLSSSASYNLVLGNNPWPGVRGGALKRRIEGRAQELDTTSAAAARIIVLDEIKKDPAGFAGRCWQRVRTLWGLDTFVLRHVLMVIYPPLSGIAIWCLLGALLIALLVSTGLIGAGIAVGPLDSQRLLLLLMAAAIAVPPTLTYSSSRMGLPLLALLLPLAGAGAVAIRSLTTGRRLVVGGLVAATALSAVTLASPGALAWPGASSHYRTTVAHLDRLLGTETPLGDCLQARVSDRVEVTLSEGYRFTRGGVRTRRVRPGQHPANLDIVSLENESSAPVPVLRLLIRAQGEAEPTEVTPIRRASWQRWTQTPVEGISVRWCGGLTRIRRLPNRQPAHR